MFLESKLGAVTLSTAITVPSGHLFRGGKICLTTSEALLAFMKGSNVDSQITFLGKAAVAAINSTFEDFPVFKADVTVRNFKMAT